MLHNDPYLLGHPDITVLSFATIGHVGKIPPKNISATGTFRRMRSSSPTFVTGQEQPPPKSGCAPRCLPCAPSVSRLTNQKNWPIRSQHLAKISITPCLKFEGGSAYDDLSRGALLLAARSLLRLTRGLYAPHPLVSRRLHCTRLTPTMDLDTYDS